MARSKAKTAPKASKAAKGTKTAKAAPARKGVAGNVITTHKAAQTDGWVFSSTANGATVLWEDRRSTPEIRAAAQVGQPISVLKALVDALPPVKARPAKGLDSRNAPHTMKAVADSRKADKAAAPAKASKAAAKAERKAKRAEKAAPRADDSRKITIKDKKFVFGGEGTSRRASWDAVKSGITVADYVKAGGKVKYLPRWVAAGAIALA